MLRDHEVQYTITVIHGPLLDQLGTREPEIYGRESLADINARITACAARVGADAQCHYAPTEAACVELLLSARGNTDVVILNPAALTHTSVLLRDTVATLQVPVLEVHLSNVAAREPFRSHSLLAPLTAGTIMGLGAVGYEVAVEAAARIWQK